MMFYKRANEWYEKEKSVILGPSSERVTEMSVNNYAGVCMLLICGRDTCESNCQEFVGVG